MVDKNLDEDNDYNNNNDENDHISLGNSLEEECDRQLEKELNEQCDLSIYVSKLELDNRPDSDLLSLSKEEIIEYKNYQLLKVKAYVASLEKEKDDLINEYKITSEKLLDRIKELEEIQSGFRPDTPMITHNILNKTNGVDASDFGLSSSIPIQPDTSYFIKQRCPNCNKNIPQSSFFEHSLNCLRKKFKCRKCGELMDDSLKSNHFNQYKDINKITKAIEENNETYFFKALDHDFPVNIMLNGTTKESIIHHICKYNRINLLAKILQHPDCDINCENGAKETPLLIAIEHNNEQCAKSLILKGANTKLRNIRDMSPLMVCCKNGYESLARILILKGSDVNEKNILGDTPLKIAQMNNHETLALILIKEFKADISPKK